MQKLSGDGGLSLEFEITQGARSHDVALDFDAGG